MPLPDPASSTGLHYDYKTGTASSLGVDLSAVSNISLVYPSNSLFDEDTPVIVPHETYKIKDNNPDYLEPLLGILSEQKKRDFLETLRWIAETEGYEIHTKVDGMISNRLKLYLANASGECIFTIETASWFGSDQTPFKLVYSPSGGGLKTMVNGYYMDVLLSTLSMFVNLEARGKNVEFEKIPK